MKIISFNAREWSRDMNPFSPYFWMKRMAAMRRMLKEEEPDVIFFQELSFPASLYIPKGYKRISDGATSHPIYALKKFYFEDVTTNSRFTAATLHDPWAGSTRLVNVHLPLSFGTEYNKIREDKNSHNLPLVCGGDFNACREFVECRLPYAVELAVGAIRVPTFQRFDSEEKVEIDFFAISDDIPPLWQEEVLIGKDYGVERMSDHWPISIIL